ncbi:hypothetical protein [Zhongshania sp.]|uniref:hypothetical protein n=1 Tax=Zhongshania sp. TaxID=1971902 RepID=UPI0039E2D695
MRVGRYSVLAKSSNIIESKSFKSYLNALDNCHFSCGEYTRGTITIDTMSVAGQIWL